MTGVPKADPGSFEDSLLISTGALRRFGITRVGDLTDLDRIGLPVWFACRPNARSLSLSQGKGLTHRQARISAVMEAIEHSVAEKTRSHLHVFGSLRVAEQSDAAPIDIGAFARCDAGSFNPATERAWVKGRSAYTGEPALAPYELVGLDMRVDFPWDRRCFRMSSLGLGAGVSFEQAASHAVLELVEDDASALFDIFGFASGAASPVQYREGRHEDLDVAVSLLRKAEIEPRFFSLESIVRVPVVAAFIPRTILSPDGPIVRYSAGYAARLSAHDAACAALLEAVQSRLTNIAGARDDLTPEEYRREMSAGLSADVGDSTLDDMAGKYGPCPAPFGDQWHELVDRFAAAGVADLLVFTLDAGEHCPVHVVRALAPGLGAATDTLSYLTPHDFRHLLHGRT